MALVRILIDGYSLLHCWPGLVPGKPRHSMAARDALVRQLARYADLQGTPITVFFDGSGTGPRKAAAESTPQVEIMYSTNGWTADQMIERAAHRFQAYGEILVVSNDRAERDIVTGFGGYVSTCESFLATLAAVFGELDREIHHHNVRERQRYRNRG